MEGVGLGGCGGAAFQMKSDENLCGFAFFKFCLGIFNHAPFADMKKEFRASAVTRGHQEAAFFFFYLKIFFCCFVLMIAVTCQERPEGAAVMVILGLRKSQKKKKTSAHLERLMDPCRGRTSSSSPLSLNFPILKCCFTLGMLCVHTQTQLLM